MKWILITPFALGFMAHFFDEFFFHMRRGLPRWERIGHPLDTLSVLSIYVAMFTLAPSPSTYWLLGVLLTFSLFIVTKDEWIHKKHCEAEEMWLHAVMFVLHPIQLSVLFVLWHLSWKIEIARELTSLMNRFEGVEVVLPVLAAGTFVVLIHQIVYWNFLRPLDESK